MFGKVVGVAMAFPADGANVFFTVFMEGFVGSEPSTGREVLAASRADESLFHHA